MDLIQGISRRDGRPGVMSFVVAGHSKRGHTAWLAAAADARVAGIIPLAIDVLNSRAQISHHRSIVGAISGPSTLFDEVIEAADSPRGRCLIDMIDPYQYRERILEPKLIVLGTQDEYTPTDALNLYWHGLRGAKSVLYLPNTTHAEVNSHPDVNPSAFAFVRAVASGTGLPAMEWKLDIRDGVAQLSVTAEEAVLSASLWSNSSEDRDFRRSRWSRTAMVRSPATEPMERESFLGEAVVPVSGQRAIFAELEFDSDRQPFKLSTLIFVIGADSTREGARATGAGEMDPD
jgi:PhoPQ-activated pathogenicity-related protein